MNVVTPRQLIDIDSVQVGGLFFHKEQLYMKGRGILHDQPGATGSDGARWNCERCVCLQDAENSFLLGDSALWMDFVNQPRVISADDVSIQAYTVPNGKAVSLVDLPAGKAYVDDDDTYYVLYNSVAKGGRRYKMAYQIECLCLKTGLIHFYRGDDMDTLVIPAKLRWTSNVADVTNVRDRQNEVHYASFLGDLKDGAIFTYHDNLYMKCSEQNEMRVIRLDTGLITDPSVWTECTPVVVSKGCFREKICTNPLPYFNLEHVPSGETFCIGNTKYMKLRQNGAQKVVDIKNGHIISLDPATTHLKSIYIRYQTAATG